MINDSDENIIDIQRFFDAEFDSRFLPIEVVAIIDFFNQLIALQEALKNDA